jgi:hypothetical protein
MSVRGWLIAGGVVVGLAGSVAAYRDFHARSLTVERSETTAFSAQPRREKPGTGNEVQHLRSELALMQGQLAGLRELVGEQKAPEPSTPAAEHQEFDPAAVQARREESARRWKEHMAEVAMAFEQETPDRSFAATSQAAVDLALQNNPAIQASAGKLDCRSRTCRIEIRDDGSGHLGKQLPLFLQAVGQTLPRAQADHVAGENGQKTMLLYLTNEQPAAQTARR